MNDIKFPGKETYKHNSRSTQSDARRRKKVGALYNAFLGLIIHHQQSIALISLSCATEYIALAVVEYIIILYASAPS